VIALYLTFTVAAYLLGPDLVSRFLLGFVCPRKNIVQSKGEEITRAIAWAVFPLALAVLWAWLYGTLRQCARWPEWKIFFSGAYSDAFFEKHSEAVFHATSAVFWWNYVVLWRMYTLVLFFWTGIALIVHYFGSIRHYLIRGGRFRHTLLKLLSFFIIPRISEWHVFLSNMLLEKGDVRINADVLTKGNILYRGEVADKTLNGDGGLTSIILESPIRFRREEYMEAKKSLTGKPNKNDFWVPIPGNTFIVMASEIVSINLTHTSHSAVVEDASIANAARRAMTASTGASSTIT
jgi:hypothetical protein